MQSSIKIPLYCITVHDTEPKTIKTTDKVYVFCHPVQPVQPIESDKQSNIYGKKYVKQIPEGAIFANTYMFPDDTILAVKEKIAYVVPGIQTDRIIKIKCYNYVTHPDDMANALVNQFFQGRRMISTQEFNDHVRKNVESKERCDMIVDESLTLNSALKYLKNHLLGKNVKIVRYVENDAAILESFIPLDNMLYVSFENNAVTKRVQFEKENVVYTQIEKAYDTLQDIMNIRMQSINKQVHVRVHPHIEIKEDIYSIFTLFKASSTIPFAKWLSQGNNAMIKVSKRFVLTDGGKKRVVVWSRIDKKKQYSTNEIIIFKVIPYENVPITASIIVYNTGVYDVKVNMSNFTKFKMYNVEKVLGDVQKIFIKEIRTVEPTDFRNVLTLPRTNRLQVMNVIVNGAFIPNISLDKTSLNVAIAEFNTIFYGVKSKHVSDSTYLYKRTTGFNDSGNIMNWISRLNSGKFAIEEIYTLYNHVDGKQIKSHIQSWAAANPDPSKFTKYFKTSAKNVNITLRQGRSGFSFILDGCTNQHEIDRIMMYIRAAVLLPNKVSKVKESKVKGSKVKGEKEVKETKLKKPVINIDSDDDDHDSDNGSVQMDFSDFLNEGGVEGPSDSDDGGEYEADEADEDVADLDRVMQMKSLNECPKMQGGGDRYVWKLLQANDPQLFATGIEGKTYAKVCQASAARQPIPISTADHNYNSKCFQGAIKKTIETGSAGNEHKMYVCPQVWCPTSKVALTLEQFAQYGNKCPFGLAETPINFMEKAYFKGERIVGRLKPHNHSKNLMMPCCFNKGGLDENGVEKEDAKDSIKYIHATLPSQGRYAALPYDLHDLLGNNKCGTDNGRRGHIQANAKCYLRYGLEPSMQPFLMCIVNAINSPKILTDVDLINVMKKKLNLAIFLTTDKGRLYQKFTFDAPWPDPGEEDLAFYREEFKTFKTFVLAQYKTLKNIFEIEGRLLKTFIEPLDKFNPNVDERNYNVMLMKRFYVFYRSYMNFITYLDSTDKKTHENILPLLKRMKIIDVNVIILNNGDIECQENMNYEKDCLILYHDEENKTYNPVHYVTHKKSLLASRALHTFGDSPILKKLGCPGKTSFERQIANMTRDGTYIYDFEFRTIACIYDGVLIPFKFPIYIESVKNVCFVDSYFRFVMSSLKTDHKQVCKVINGINTCLQYKYIELQSRTDKFINLSNEYIIPFIPLTRCTYSDVDIKRFYIDGNIFSTIQYNDERSQYVSVEVYKQALFETLLNEVINLYIHIDNIKEEVDFIRHQSNPLTINEKITYLRKFFIEKSPLKSRFFKLNVRENLKNISMPPTKKPIICSKLYKSKCLENNLVCTWVTSDGVGKRGHTRSTCKVKFSSDDDFDIFLDKAMYHLTNPHNILALKVQQGVATKPIMDDDTFMYEHKSQVDLETKLTLFNVRNEDFDINTLEIDSINVEQPDAFSLKPKLVDLKKPPSIPNDATTSFHLNKNIKLSKISNGDIYIAFLVAYNMQVGVKDMLMSVDQFKFILDTLDDDGGMHSLDLIKHLAKKTNVNIIITKTPLNDTKTLFMPYYQGKQNCDIQMMFHMHDAQAHIYNEPLRVNGFIFDTLLSTSLKINKLVYLEKNR